MCHFKHGHLLDVAVLGKMCHVFGLNEYSGYQPRKKGENAEMSCPSWATIKGSATFAIAVIMRRETLPEEPCNHIPCVQASRLSPFTTCWALGLFRDKIAALCRKRVRIRELMNYRKRSKTFFYSFYR